jgi:hypothetical protein
MAGSGSRIYSLTFSYLSRAMVPVPDIVAGIVGGPLPCRTPQSVREQRYQLIRLTNTVESVIRLACACAATGSMRATLRTWCARVDADAAFPTLAEWQLDRIPRAN